MNASRIDRDKAAKAAKAWEDTARLYEGLGNGEMQLAEAWRLGDRLDAVLRDLEVALRFPSADKPDAAQELFALACSHFEDVRKAFETLTTVHQALPEPPRGMSDLVDANRAGIRRLKEAVHYQKAQIQNLDRAKRASVPARDVGAGASTPVASRP